MARQVKRISDLPAAEPLEGDELLEMVQGGINVRVRADQLGGGGPIEMTDVVGLPEALDGKVDKVSGKGLSANDLTDPLYDKLVGLEGTHWRGTFVSLSALEAGVTDPVAGDYADVDAAAADVERYIWDATDSEWVVQSGAVAPVTAAQVKQLYESNPDTNAFTDADIITLAGIQPQIDDINLLIGDIGAALDAINGEVV